MENKHHSDEQIRCKRLADDVTREFAEKMKSFRSLDSLLSFFSTHNILSQSLRVRDGD